MNAPVTGRLYAYYLNGTGRIVAHTAERRYEKKIEELARKTDIEKVEKEIRQEKAPSDKNIETNSLFDGKGKHEGLGKCLSFQEIFKSNKNVEK